MSQPDAFNRILASLSDAMLDDTLWSATSALIGDACRIKGNSLVYGHGRSYDDIQISFLSLCYRGQRHKALEREYFDVYYPQDERVPRVRRLPDSQIVHVRDLFTEQELKTSPTYNEVLLRADYQNSLSVRMDGPSGSRIVWSLADPVDGDGWSSAQTEMIARILPHLHQFVRVRQALVDSGALGASLTGLLDNRRAGVIQLDRRGRIVAANDSARDLLRGGDGLSDRGGMLSARSRKDDAELQKLLSCALPRFMGQGASGSMIVKRPSGSPPLALHVSPLGGGQLEFRPWRIAALVLLVESGRQVRVDPALVMAALDLTPAQSQVAVLLADGKTVREIATATGRSESTIRWHVRQIFNKHGISRLQQLVQMLSSLVGIPWPRR